MSLIPIPWAVLSYYVGIAIYRLKTVGLVPGDTRFNRAWEAAIFFQQWTFFVGASILIIVSLHLLVRRELRRNREGVRAIAIVLIAVPLSLLTGFLSFMIVYALVTMGV